jgi:SAM-dependent methyltransferase
MDAGGGQVLDMRMGTATKAEDRLQRWCELWGRPVRGWDVDEFAGRIEEAPPPWCYAELARHELSLAGSAIALGVGCGEFLVSLRDRLPVEMHATEGRPPNLPVARAALEPLGVIMRRYDAEWDEAMPYRDECVDLVLCRHEQYAASEVARVLRPGGWFLTQQVEGHDLDDLAAVFGAGPARPAVTMSSQRRQLEEAGLVVERAQAWHGRIRFDAVETLLAYLRRMPWLLPDDFSVERYAEVLLELEHRREPLEFTQRRLLLLAHREEPEPKPAPFIGW